MSDTDGASNPAAGRGNGNVKKGLARDETSFVEGRWSVESGAAMNVEPSLTGDDAAHPCAARCRARHQGLPLLRPLSMERTTRCAGVC